MTVVSTWSKLLSYYYYDHIWLFKFGDIYTDSASDMVGKIAGTLALIKRVPKCVLHHSQKGKIFKEAVSHKNILNTLVKTTNVIKSVPLNKIFLLSVWQDRKHP